MGSKIRKREKKLCIPVELFVKKNTSKYLIKIAHPNPIDTHKKMPTRDIKNAMTLASEVVKTTTDEYVKKVTINKIFHIETSYL
jgi:hypothetical protein